MLNKIICAGVGGQGVLTLGMILAEAAAAQDKYVTWVPSYGSEMRGGAASCQIKISDEPIGSPYIQEMDVLVALTEKSVDEYTAKVADGGYIIINSSVVEKVPEGLHCKAICIPASEIALKEENPKGVGVIIVGAIIACTGLLPFETARETIKEYFQHKGIAVEPNERVFTAGYEYVKNII